MNLTTTVTSCCHPLTLFEKVTCNKGIYNLFAIQCQTVLLFSGQIIHESQLFERENQNNSYVVSFGMKYTKLKALGLAIPIASINRFGKCYIY